MSLNSRSQSSQVQYLYPKTFTPGAQVSTYMCNLQHLYANVAGPSGSCPKPPTQLVESDLGVMGQTFAAYETV